MRHALVHHPTPACTILLLAVILSALFLATATQPTVLTDRPLKQPYNISKNFDDWIDRIKALSTQSPTANVLRQTPSLAAKLAPVYDLFDNMTDLIERRIAQKTSDACSLRLDTGWVASSLKRVKTFQLGAYDDSCLSHVESEKAISNRQVPSSFPSDVLNVLRNARDNFFEATSRSSLLEFLQTHYNWQGFYKLSRFGISDRGQECLAEYMFAYRVESKWYIRHSITNRGLRTQMSDWQRNYTHEYIARDLTTLPMVHEKWDDSTRLMNASTLMVSWEGTPSPGSIRTSFLRDVDQSIAVALRRNEISIDQSSDSVTPSNIAILALPMVMSFVPVSFLADLDTCGMLMYSLFTDVFATVPFLIKGIELVHSATNRQKAANVFYMGNATLAQMEINAAECVGETKFRITGWVFIVVALVMMGLGVMLEIVAARWMRRRRKMEMGEQKHEVSGPIGATRLITTAYKFFGKEKGQEENDGEREPVAYAHDRSQESSTHRTWMWRNRARRRTDIEVGRENAAQAFDHGYPGIGEEHSGWPEQ